MEKPSFDLNSLVGQRVDAAKQRCEEDGFTVEVIKAGLNAVVTLDLNFRRIRLLVERNRVIEARQG